MKHDVYVYETWKLSRSHNHKGTVTVWHVFFNKDSYINNLYSPNTW